VTFLADLEVLPGQAGDRPSLLIEDDHVHGHELGAGGKDDRRRRGLGLGCAGLRSEKEEGQKRRARHRDIMPVS
jgi:hypothetical protein